MALRAVVGGCVLVTLLILALVLGPSSPQIASTDRVPNNIFVARLTDGQTLCQSGELIPRGASAIRMTIGTYGAIGPRTVVLIRSSGRVIARGGLARGWRQGIVELPISLVRRSARGTVCIGNRGHATLALAGLEGFGIYGFVERINGVEQAAEIRLDYMLAGSRSWYSMIGTLVHRMTLAKGSLFRLWEWLAALLLACAVGVIVVRLAAQPDDPA
jgi:hypothetical protein